MIDSMEVLFRKVSMTADGVFGVRLSEFYGLYHGLREGHSHGVQ